MTEPARPEIEHILQTPLDTGVDGETQLPYSIATCSCGWVSGTWTAEQMAEQAWAQHTALDRREDGKLTPLQQREEGTP